jgi:hypothetical protein
MERNYKYGHLLTELLMHQKKASNRITTQPEVVLLKIELSKRIARLMSHKFNDINVLEKIFVLELEIKSTF